ncbi:MAG: ABC transporter ATP-binding protein [Actinobacteria bacterium]|nr:ABC transporter ATP-binding protein [Actinomycetota bacterium]
MLEESLASQNGIVTNTNSTYIDTDGNSTVAVDVRSISKIFRIYHGKNPSLKDAILKGKRVTYEEFLALDNVSFSVYKGETFGIIGPNGSGKSTLLKLIARILVPNSGEIVINGSVSALLELGAGFHADLTGRENIYINAAILGMKKREIDKKFDEIVRFSELERFIDTPVKNYSSGMYMRLGFSVAINVNPDILLVDEVLAVGDQAFQSKCYQVIYDFMRRGKTIIIVSHDLETISDLCKRVAFLKNGKIEDIGNPIVVINKYRSYIEEMERKRIIEQQKEERKKIFKSLVEGERKVIDGEEIDKLSRVSINGEVVNRFGSGDAEIKRIRLVDKDGKDVDFCKYGDEVNIVMDVLFNTEVEDPIFGIRITDHRGNIVYGTNNRLNNIRSGTFKKGDLVKVIFSQRIVFIGGTYFVSPSVGYKDTKTYCDWVNNMLTINVIHHNRAEGIADLNSEITIEKISS